MRLSREDIRRRRAIEGREDGLETLAIRELVAHAAHFLPSQGPITAFVHHNTLHAFEHLPFERAVERAAVLYGWSPYLGEERGGRETAERLRRMSADVLARWGEARIERWRCGRSRGSGRERSRRTSSPHIVDQSGAPTCQPTGTASSMEDPQPSSRARR